MTRKPAIIGGKPAFAQRLPFVQPTCEEPKRVQALIQSSLRTGLLTDGPLVRRLEERVADRFQVDHCVAVSSCTTGLMLVLQAVSPLGRVVLPSFTFSATAHAVSWNRLPLEFADCDPKSWLLGPDQLVSRPALILGVHISGMPCDVEGLQKAAHDMGATLIFDAAHGAGAFVEIGGTQRPIGGFGLAEVFSLSPTKVLSGAEGGLVTTSDEGLAEQIRLARNYGNPGSYDTVTHGLNGRMSEVHAALALVALEHLSERSDHRNQVAARYREGLSDLPGIQFQEAPNGRHSSYKDFTVLVDADFFGCSRDAVVSAFHAEGIPTRPYYSPPVHQQSSYRGTRTGPLPVTESLAERVISLPIWSHLPLKHVDRISDAALRIHQHAREVELAVSIEARSRTELGDKPRPM